MAPAGGQRRRERRVAGGAIDGRRARLIDRQAVRGAQHGPAVAGERPRQAEPRLEVAVVLAIDLLDVDAHPHQRRGGRVEHHELVVALGRRHVPFVAQPEIDGQRRTNGDGVLREERERVLDDAAAALAKGDAEGVGGAREERGHAGEVELAGAFREVVVVEAAELAAGLHRVTAGNRRDRVVEHVERVVRVPPENWPGRRS